MNEEKSLEELRAEIDACDEEIVNAFCRRMDISAGIAEYKARHNKPVTDMTRERARLSAVSDMAGKEYSDYTRVLYSTVMSLSRTHQQKLIGEKSPTLTLIDKALEETPELFPGVAQVACQGTEGAYSQIAAERLFSYPEIRFYRTFENVFSAVESGEAKYGVIPFENSTAGTVSGVLDLLKEKNVYIVRAVRIKINHCFLAKPGTKIEDIREIFSHEQAVNQCAGFLKTLKNVKVTICANTAQAARSVSESERTDTAALSSLKCAELYNLEAVRETVQDSGNNHTRFICISRTPEIYPGANKTSIMTAADNRPGALYAVLSQFFALGINLVKLESRPIPERDFEFMFYFDIEVPVYSPKLRELLSTLEKLNPRFRYLGSFTETL